MYAPDVKPTVLDMALRHRNALQTWILYSYESSSTRPAISNPEIVRHFNYSLWYGSRADFPITWLGDIAYSEIEHFATTKTNRIGAILCLYSTCESASDRLNLIDNLTAAFATRNNNGSDWVHCYGKCKKNRSWPKDLGGDHAIYGASRAPDSRSRKIQLQQRYKFELVIQNSLCADFVDEKIYDAMRQGTIPIYKGAWNIDSLFPSGYKFFVNMDDFGTDYAGLAEYIRYLDRNHTAYMEYFTWHELVKQSLPGKLLLPPHSPTRDGNFFCFFCRAIIDDRIFGTTHQAQPDDSCCDELSTLGCERKRKYLEARKKRAPGPNLAHMRKPIS